MEFWNVEINEKIFKRLIIAVLVFILVYMGFTMSSLLICKSYKIGENTSENDEKIRTHIDSISSETKKIEITGWAYKEGEETETANSSFVIKHQESGRMYLMRTQMKETETLDNLGYSHGGLHAQCLTLGLPKGTYQIFILYKNNDENILADTLIPFEIK